ncbi:MAG TPA: tetratricopeptide repeat protein [Terriglobia bacterium]
MTILGPGGLKIAGASVSIELEGASFRLKGVTRGDGTYLASQLESGRYRIGVAAPCYAASQGEVKVEAGHRATATITLAVASLTPAAPGGVTCPAAPGDADMQFSDSGELKPGELSGAVDAAGYSSQAETQGAEMRHALADLAAAGPKQTDNQSEPGVFDRGNNLLLQGDYSGASSVFQQGAAQYPHSAEMLLGLGVASYSRGRYEEAVGVLCQAVDLNPTDRRAYFFLVQAYAASPVRTEPVLQRLGSYAAREPQDAAAQYYYAFGLWRARAGAGQVDGTGEATSRSDAERVEQLLRSAIALDPSLVEAHFQLGVVLSEQGKNTQAITELQRTVTLQPDWAEAHYRLARLYGQTGEKDKAQRELADYQRLQKKGVAQDPRLQDEVRRFLGTGGR